jgi:hypothetical protein
MKSLIKFLANSELGVLIRNTLNFKPVDLKLFTYKAPITVSDAFLWRTDNGYKTKFKYSDILNLFYKVKNSFVEIHIYSKNNQLLKIENFSNLNISNEFEITSEYLNNLQDYGLFYIYHFTKDKLDNQKIINNRCYLGYSKNDSLYSFVHGNTLAKFTTIYPSKKISSNIVKTSIYKNQYYTIQKFFSGFDKNELFFANPTTKILKFNLEKKNYILPPGSCQVVETTNSILTIKSNCLFLRPTVFSYKNKYFDVHHS